MVANGPEDPALLNFKFYYKELLQSWRSQLKLMGHKICHSLARLHLYITLCPTNRRRMGENNKITAVQKKNTVPSTIAYVVTRGCAI